MKNFDSCLGNGRKEACAIIGLLNQHFKWPNLDHLSRRRPLKSLEPLLLKAACLNSTRALLTQGWKGLACFFLFSLDLQLALQSVLVACKLLCSVFSQRKRKQSRLVVRALWHTHHSVMAEAFLLRKVIAVQLPTYSLGCLCVNGCHLK